MMKSFSYAHFVFIWVKSSKKVHSQLCSILCGLGQPSSHMWNANEPQYFFQLYDLISGSWANPMMQDDHEIKEVVIETNPIIQDGEEMKEVVSEPDILIMNPGSRFVIDEKARNDCLDINDIECMTQVGPDELVAEARGTYFYSKKD